MLLTPFAFPDPCCIPREEGLATENTEGTDRMNMHLSMARGIRMAPNQGEEWATKNTKEHENRENAEARSRMAGGAFHLGDGDGDEGGEVG